MKPLFPLRDDQATGAHPDANAWVSASAGTGKTQVLSARVLRLLLDGAAPDRILCLTFTKAGAAEMQGRIFDRLAHWVRCPAADLAADLTAIRADAGPAALARARTLFATTLDAHGGLRVQTLHAYAQSLLAAFPIEAGIAPGFVPLDDRAAGALRKRILVEAIERAAASGDRRFLDDVGAISIARGEGSVDTIAGVLIRHAGAVAALGPAGAIEPRLRRAFGLPGEGSRDELLGAAVAALDEPGLRALAARYLASGTASYARRGDELLCWLGYAPGARVANLDLLCKVFHKKTADERYKDLAPGGSRADPGLVALAERLCAEIDALVERRRRLDMVDTAARHLRVGTMLCAAYAAHKRRAGAIDYDDMIRLAAELLQRPGMGDWVRYKLDARIDHLLVDEAQDTNAAQWQIVRALSDEFFDGEGARELHRTLFVVGDFKQAIFRFQGSDPRLFTEAREDYRQRIDDAQLDWRDVALAASFRSVPAVLDVVDAVIDELTPAALGLPERPPRPEAARGELAGAVTLWPPLGDEDDDEETDERAWLPPGQVRMAHRLARQIAAWTQGDDRLWLPARGRHARPEDILVLVRARGEFVQPLVGALHDARVPVAGADRLRLTEPLAVQDCLALIRFVLQPGDDLTCATLLMSPFVGLDHDALFALAHRRPGTLWRRVQDAGGAAADWLGTVLALADFGTPYDFLETVLSGPLGGRAALLRRLGEEAREAVQAVLGEALAFEAANPPTLQGFLAWMEGHDTDIKRDPDAPLDAVRIMTVHGAKGLQAPIVVLADATRDTARHGDHVLIDLGDGDVPVFHGGAAGRVGALADAADDAAARDAEEHWRLLYVALTRAEDLLFVGGPLPRRRGEKPPEVPADSWYAVVARALAGLDTAVEADGWGETRVYRRHADAAPHPDPRAAAPPPPEPVPDWLRGPAPVEARPPRPLSPTELAADTVAMPPPTPAMRAAARRGTLLHGLFETLPGLPDADRDAAAARRLAARAPDLDDATRAELAATALGVVRDAAFAGLFGADALAEAPIAAVVGGQVVAGTVDRLLVTNDAVTIVDFKTGARVPAAAAEVEPYHLKQMAAYATALGVIFPGRAVAAALLYTHGSKLIALPAELLAAHAPRLGSVQETLGASPR